MSNLKFWTQELRDAKREHSRWSLLRKKAELHEEEHRVGLINKQLGLISEFIFICKKKKMKCLEGEEVK
jgi:hypothetical protein